MPLAWKWLCLWLLLSSWLRIASLQSLTEPLLLPTHSLHSQRGPRPRLPLPKIMRNFSTHVTAPPHLPTESVVCALKASASPRGCRIPGPTPDLLSQNLHFEQTSSLRSCNRVFLSLPPEWNRQMTEQEKFVSIHPSPNPVSSPWGGNHSEVHSEWNWKYFTTYTP